MCCAANVFKPGGGWEIKDTVRWFSSYTARRCIHENGLKHTHTICIKSTRHLVKWPSSKQRQLRQVWVSGVLPIKQRELTKCVFMCVELWLPQQADQVSHTDTASSLSLSGREQMLVPRVHCGKTVGPLASEVHLSTNSAKLLVSQE